MSVRTPPTNGFPCLALIHTNKKAGAVTVACPAFNGRRKPRNKNKQRDSTPICNHTPRRPNGMELMYYTSSGVHRYSVPCIAERISYVLESQRTKRNKRFLIGMLILGLPTRRYLRIMDIQDRI